MKLIFFIIFAICCAQVKSFEVLSEILKDFPNQCSADIKRAPFVKIGQKYYFVEATKQLNWFAAAHFCRTMNANLAAIDTAEKMVAISNHLKVQSLTNKRFWTSGNDLGIETKFEWLSTGKPMYYTKWATGEPNNLEKNENCVQLFYNGNEFLMNDFFCNLEGYYICEAESEPKTIALTIL